MAAMKDNGFLGGIYGIAVIGAAYYFFGNVTSFWSGVYAVIKAFLWPAVLVYKLLAYLKL
jgi:hypothetical protein